MTDIITAHTQKKKKGKRKIMEMKGMKSIDLCKQKFSFIFKKNVVKF